MEALWSNFLPSYFFLKQQLKNEAIGDIFHLQINSGFNYSHMDRVVKPELGGGTILLFGVYLINLMRLTFNNEIPEKIVSVGNLNQFGADDSFSASVLFSRGRTATITATSKVRLPCEAHIVGTRGIIKVIIK